MRVLVTGGSGRLGSALVPALERAGHTVLSASRRGPVKVDLSTGEGLSAAVADVECVVHAASAPFRDESGVDRAGSERLVAAAPHAHIVYTSIVGIDRVPTSYYTAKLDAEGIIARAPRHTILRITQFHSFVAEIATLLARSPVTPLPSCPLQPVDLSDVSEAIVACVARGPVGRAPDLGGPDIVPFDVLAKSYLRSRGYTRLYVPLPLFFTASGRALSAGGLTCGDAGTRGRVSFDRWVGSGPNP